MNETCKIYDRTPLNITKFYCDLMKFEADLYYYDFGYICMGPLALILVISVFGKIKENYRWFIANQVIWDLFVSYTNYSCYSAINVGIKPQRTCFFLTQTYLSNYTNFARSVDIFATDIITYNPYTSLLLLTSIRFIALYFPHLFEKLTKGKKVFSTIIAFNFFAILFDISSWFRFLQEERRLYLLGECVLKRNITKAQCLIQNDYHVNDSWYKFFQSLYAAFITVKTFKPPLFIFFSVIATILIILKIGKQAKFQLKHNRRDFIASLRITVVICLQTIIYCFVFFVEAFSMFIPRIISTYELKIRTARMNVIGQDYSGYLDIRLPEWFDNYFGLTSESSRQMFVQFRILIESFIVLVIMTGYREAVIDFVKFLYRIIRNPVKTLKALKFSVKKSNVSKTTVF